MVYYSRYPTGKIGVMIGFALLQLVTFKPEAVDFPEAQPKQSLPCSSNISTTWHSIASVYSALTKYVLILSTIMVHPWSCMRNPSFVKPCHGCWRVSSCNQLPFFWLIKCMASLTMHWNSSLPWTSTIRRCSSLNLENRAPCTFLWLVCRRISYLQNKRFLHPSHLDLLLPDQATWHRSLLLHSPHPKSRDEISVRGEGYNIPDVKHIIVL
jgi:hypothetical protein